MEIAVKETYRTRDRGTFFHFGWLISNLEGIGGRGALETLLLERIYFVGNIGGGGGDRPLSPHGSAVPENIAPFSR